MATWRGLLVAVTMSSLPVAGAFAAEPRADAPGKRMALGSIDTDQDGRVSFEEFKAGAMKRVERQFNWMDANNDRYIDRTELEAIIEQIHKRRSVPGDNEQ